MCKQCEELVKYFAYYIKSEKERVERQHQFSVSNTSTLIDNLKNGIIPY